MKRAVVGLVLAVAALAAPADTAAQYFGRNKVQYRSFDFRIIRTEHFDVHYYPGEREAALDAARMVERAYARLSRVLQHEFNDRKPLILYASHTDFQQTNALPMLIDEGTGGVTEALKNRMILPFTGSYADFDHVLTHELVHAFQYDVIFRRGFVNEANPFVARLPLWFMEGMAEYLSIGTVDPHTKSWLRDASLSGYLRTIDEMSVRDDYLSYRFGQSLWAYIGSKWGDEVVGILLQRAPRVGIDRAFASTLGVTLEELSADWSASVRAAYLPEVTDRTLPATIAKRLTNHDAVADPWYLAPAISPDGERMVYLSQEDGFFFDLSLADARTGRRERRLVEAARDAAFESLRYMNSGAAFSPDGRYVAFVAKAGGQDALYLYDLERRTVWRRLKFDLNGLANPSWSPDGRRLAFTGLDGGLSDLFLTDLEGNVDRLTEDRYADLLPAWSPDGRTIAFSTDRGPGTDLDRLTYGNLRVALYDLGTRGIRILPHQDDGKNLNPVWSPDGSSLIWVSDRSGTNDLYAYQLADQRLERLTTLLSGVIAITPLSPVLSWSRTGRLLFTYFEEAGYNIYALEDPLALPRVPVSAAVAAGPGSERTGSGIAGVDPYVEPTGPRDLRSPASWYRTESGFRPSAEPRRTRDAPGPVSVVALLDSAALALPDTLAFGHDPYRVRFTPDVIGRPTVGAQVGGYYGNGIYGGSYIALSDMLGNHNIVAAANVNGSLADASFYTGYSFLKRRANVGGSISQFPLYRYLGSAYLPLEIDGVERQAAANLFLRDVIRTGQLNLSYPFSAFRRIELGARGVLYDSDVLYRGVDRATGEPLHKDADLGSLAYFEPSAALVFDNSLFGWTGPVYGRRYRFQLSRTFGDLQFTEALIDFRNYWNIEQTVVLAARMVGLTRFGQDADRFSLYWGGPYFLRGYDGGSFELGSRECQDSRYYAGTTSLSRCPVRDQLIGSSAAFMNLEARVPIITELQIGFIGNFPPVDGVVFFDGGLAWDARVCAETDVARPERCADGAGRDVEVTWDRGRGEDPFLVREPLFSYGFGLRINVFYTVLRFDYAFPLNRPDRGGIFSISFGPSF